MHVLLINANPNAYRDTAGMNHQSGCSKFILVDNNSLGGVLWCVLLLYMYIYIYICKGPRTQK